MRLVYLNLVLFSSLTALANQLAPWVGPNVRLGEDPVALPLGNGRNQAEPHVTRSSADPDLIMATFQEGRYPDGGAVSNGYAVSRDGGFTWDRALNPNLTFASGGPFFRATDPVAGIALDGTLYLNSLVSVDSSFGLGRLVVQRSKDFGQTWTDPITVYNGTNLNSLNRIFPDKNWMVVNDIPGTPTTGRVVCTWTNFRTIKVSTNDIEDYVIMSSYSDNEGLSWSLPVFVTPPDDETYSRRQYQGSMPVFLPEGDLAIVYHNFMGTQLEVRYSPDGGETYPYLPVKVHDRYILYDAPNMREGMFLPTADAASETGDLYMAYTSRIFGPDTYGHIFFVRSNRTSSTIPANSAPQWNFSEPVNISGTVPARVTCTPTISVTPDGQRVTVFFYDNRNGTGVNDSGDFYAVQSVDGGSTWTDPFRITEVTFPLNRATQTGSGYMLGDYFGFAPPMGTDQAAVAVWVGNPLATADPWSCRIGNSGINVLDSWIQTNLSYAERSGTVSDYLADPDRDGTPNFLEYITGRSPRVADDPGPLQSGFTHYRINSQTDPATQVQVFAGSGDWPHQQQTISVTPFVDAHGEGYWDLLAWQNASGLEQLQFRINGVEDWHLLQEGSPSRWVMKSTGNWVWSPWLGYMEATHAPWLYHETLGWLYDLRGALYSTALDAYVFPSPANHPWVYTSTGSFIYLHPTLPYVFEPGSGDWVKMQ